MEMLWMKMHEIIDKYSFQGCRIPKNFWEAGIFVGNGKL